MSVANHVAFNERFLDRLLRSSPTGKPVQFWDKACPNLGVRVSGTKGSITFYVVKRVGAATAATWFRLGRYPILTLPAARDRALSLVRQITEGKDPASNCRGYTAGGS